MNRRKIHFLERGENLRSLLIYQKSLAKDTHREIGALGSGLYEEIEILLLKDAVLIFPIKMTLEYFFFFFSFLHS